METVSKPHNPKHKRRKKRENKTRYPPHKTNNKKKKKKHKEKIQGFFQAIFLKEMRIKLKIIEAEDPENAWPVLETTTATMFKMAAHPSAWEREIALQLPNRKKARAIEKEVIMTPAENPGI